MASNTTKYLLVALVLMASISQTVATCRIFALKFRLLGCARSRWFVCRILDFKMNFLKCKQFGCENYRRIKTYCTFNCRRLTIRNGICPLGKWCCLNQPFLNSTGTEYDMLEVPESDAFDLISPELGIGNNTN